MMIRGPFGTDGIDYYPKKNISRLHIRLPSPIIEEPEIPTKEYDYRAPFGTDDQFFYPVKEQPKNKGSPHISIPSSSSTKKSENSVFSDFSGFKSVFQTSKNTGASQDSINTTMNRIFSTLNNRIPTIEDSQQMEKILREEDIPFIQSEFDDIKQIISEIQTSTIKAEMYQPQQKAKILNETISEWQLKIEPLLDPIRSDTHKLNLKIKDTDKLSKEFAEKNSVDIQRIGQEVLTLKNQVDKLISKAANSELRFEPAAKNLSETNSRWEIADQRISKLFNEFVDNNKSAVVDVAKRLSSDIRNESIKRADVFADAFRTVSLLTKNSASNFIQLRESVVNLEKEMNGNVGELNKKIKESMQKSVDLQKINEDTLHESFDKLFDSISPLFENTRRNIVARIKEIKTPMDLYTEEKIPILEKEKESISTKLIKTKTEMNDFQEKIECELNSRIDPLAEFLANTQVFAENQIDELNQQYNEALPFMQRATEMIDEAENVITSVERSMSDLSVLVSSQLASMNQQLEQTRSEFFNTRQVILSTLSQFSSTLNKIETSTDEEDYVLSDATHNFENALFTNLDGRLNAFESVLGVVKHNISELLNGIEIPFTAPALPEIPPMPSPIFEKFTRRPRISITKYDEEGKTDYTINKEEPDNISEADNSLNKNKNAETSDFESNTSCVTTEICSPAESVAINAGLYSESYISSQFIKSSSTRKDEYDEYEYYYSDESEGSMGE